MTNERIAEELIATIPHLSDEAWSCTDSDDILRESAARLRKMDVLKMKVSELRECLKEAIREKCPFTRMSCKHGEPCDYECGTDKWRKALREEGGAK